MPSRWKTIGDELASVVNAGAYSQTFAAKRVNWVDVQANKAKDLAVRIAPIVWNTSPDTRANNLTLLKIGVYVLQACGGGTEDTEIAKQDTLMQLRDEIEDHLVSETRNGIAGYAAQVATLGDRNPFDIEAMSQACLYLGSVEVEVRID